MGRRCQTILLWFTLCACTGMTAAFIAQSLPVSKGSTSTIRATSVAANKHLKLTCYSGNGGDVRRGTSRTSCLFAKKKSRPEDDDEGEEAMSSFPMPSALKKASPATLIVLPFVAIFGLDLLLNIAVVTKRSIEVALTGQYTVWNPFE